MRSINTRLSITLGVCALALDCGFIVTAHAAKQHAMVVGINQYRHAEQLPSSSGNLEGAVNDALLLTERLREAGVAIPEERILLDAEATRTRVLDTWRAMVQGAEPGDTLIFTYAGHGGQEQEYAPPRDEPDGLDETLMLHDFDPSNPAAGRISDDELQGLFRAATDYHILVLADTCHSGGLVRTLPADAPVNLRRRGEGTPWALPIDIPPPPPPAPPSADDPTELPHVTWITAAAADSLTVEETRFEDKIHGALSWYFAQALTGAADGNGDGQLSRLELQDYLQVRVRTWMKNTQTPRLLPRGDGTPVVSLAAASPPPSVETTLAALPIVVHGGEPPASLKQIQVQQDGRLRFSIQGTRTEVYNQRGDLLSVIETDNTAAWQKVIDGQRLLAGLEERISATLRPLEISLAQGDKRHALGERMDFSVDYQGEPALRALSLFNLAGDGSFQPLYPLSIEPEDKPVLESLPFVLPPFKVMPPVGGDTLVGVLCTSPPTALHDLMNNAGQPAPARVLRALEGHRCQIGLYAFFSTDEQQR